MCVWIKCDLKWRRTWFAWVEGDVMSPAHSRRCPRHSHTYWCVWKAAFMYVWQRTTRFTWMEGNVPSTAPALPLLRLSLAPAISCTRITGTMPLSCSCVTRIKSSRRNNMSMKSGGTKKASLLPPVTASEDFLLPNACHLSSLFIWSISATRIAI